MKLRRSKALATRSGFVLIGIGCAVCCAMSIDSSAAGQESVKRNAQPVMLRVEVEGQRVYARARLLVALEIHEEGGNARRFFKVDSLEALLELASRFEAERRAIDAAPERFVPWKFLADEVDPTTGAITPSPEENKSRFTGPSGLMAPAANVEKPALPFVAVFRRWSNDKTLYFRVGQGTVELPVVKQPLADDVVLYVPGTKERVPLLVEREPGTGRAYVRALGAEERLLVKCEPVIVLSKDWGRFCKILSADQNGRRGTLRIEIPGPRNTEQADLPEIQFPPELEEQWNRNRSQPWQGNRSGNLKN